MPKHVEQEMLCDENDLGDGRPVNEAFLNNEGMIYNIDRTEVIGAKYYIDRGKI